MDEGIKANTHTPEQILIRSARTTTGLSQTGFAEKIQTPLWTYQEWEQGRSVPSGAVICLMNVILNNPKIVHELKVA